jgi:HK97 gp10 family phage protein
MSDPRVTIKGLADFKVKLAAMPANLQKGVVRKLMREAMMVVRQDARANAPKLAKPVLKNGVPVRLPGTLQKAISVRSSKAEDKAGNVGMYVNVRPLKGNTYKRAGSFTNQNGNKQSRYLLVKKSQRGADNPRDPYYWRWIEFGTKARKTKTGKALGAVRAHSFLHKAANSLQQAVDKFTAGMVDWSRRANNTGRIE